MLSQNIDPKHVLPRIINPTGYTRQEHRKNDHHALQPVIRGLRKLRERFYLARANVWLTCHILTLVRSDEIYRIPTTMDLLTIKQNDTSDERHLLSDNMVSPYQGVAEKRKLQRTNLIPVGYQSPTMKVGSSYCRGR